MTYVVSSAYQAHVDDRVDVLNLDGSVAYRGVIIRVDGAVTVRPDGLGAAIAEHPESVRPVVEPVWL